MGRYSDRKILRLKDDFYRRMLEEKGVKNLLFYDSVLFPPIDKEVTALLTPELYAWGVGDNYYKLAEQKYGDKDFWWVLAWYNQKPSDALLKIGDNVWIPRPVEILVSYYFNNT